VLIFQFEGLEALFGGLAHQSAPVATGLENILNYTFFWKRLFDRIRLHCNTRIL